MRSYSLRSISRRALRMRYDGSLALRDVRKKASLSNPEWDVRSKVVTVEKSPLVLVIDDNEDNRRIYADGLSFSGFRVEEAPDGTSGVERARSMQPEVIVMDLAMPGLDGVEATRILKQDAMTRTIGIVALTAYSEPKLRARAREAGADFYVTKPCIPSELAVHVHECIRRRKR